MNQRYWLWCIIAVSVLLSALWAISTPPPINGVGIEWRSWGNFHPDEGSHISVLRWMAAHPGALPPYESPYDTSVHPPLYHGMAALVFGGTAPLLGEKNALYLLRLLSAAMGGGTVYYVYRATRATRVGRSAALVAAALVALLPMRVALSGAVTNENLAALGSAGALAFLFEGMRYGFDRRRLIGVIGWTTAAIGAKITCVGLLPAVLIGFAFAGRRRGEGPGRIAARFAALLGVLALVLGWWFVYNTVHFGDPLRKAAADRIWDAVQPGYAVLGKLHHFGPGRYLVSILGNGWLSFWGRFDGMRHAFPSPVYALLLLLQIAGFVGLWGRLRRMLPRSPVERIVWSAMGLYVAWVLLVYCQYNWAHYTPQGRYFFVLLAPFGALLAGGMDQLLRWSLPRPATRNIVWAALGVFLLVLNLYALYVMPRFRPAFVQAARASVHDTTFISLLPCRAKDRYPG